MKVVVTGRDFSTNDSTAVDILRAQGLEVVDHSDANCGANTSEDVVIGLVQDAEIAIAGLEPYSAKVLDACPNLKMISRRGIGYDSVDIEACKARGITVTRTAGAVEAAVAEHVMAYVLYFARQIHTQADFMHKAEWHRLLVPGAKNRTIGLIGFGGIGKEVAKRANAFGMHVLYYNRHPDLSQDAALGVQYADLDTLLAQSDYVSVNVPLTPATQNLMSAENIAKMKQDAVLINIARSPIVDVDALADALKAGKLKGAGVDVFAVEPCTDSPLVACENAVLTPHTAPYTSENFVQMNVVSAQNVIDFLHGEIQKKHLLLGVNHDNTLEK